MTKRRLISAALTLAMCLAAAPVAPAQPGDATDFVDTAPDSVVVNHEPPVVETRTFDPKNPPDDMPPLKPGEAAVTESSFSCETLVEVLIPSQAPSGTGTCRATVKVASVRATLRLDITIWIPHRDAHKLTEHEHGHRVIEERYYAGAKQIAERLGRDLIGREFTAEAIDCDAAVQAASKSAAHQLNGEYMAAVQYPAARAQIIYDELTDHGRNSIKEEQAIELAMKKQRVEHRAATSKPSPAGINSD